MAAFFCSCVIVRPRRFNQFNGKFFFQQRNQQSNRCFLLGDNVHCNHRTLCQSQAAAFRTAPIVAAGRSFIGAQLAGNADQRAVCRKSAEYFFAIFFKNLLTFICRTPLLFYIISSAITKHKNPHSRCSKAFCRTHDYLLSNFYANHLGHRSPHSRGY